jgi:hypothetical protein
VFRSAQRFAHGSQEGSVNVRCASVPARSGSGQSALSLRPHTSSPVSALWARRAWQSWTFWLTKGEPVVHAAVGLETVCGRPTVRVGVTRWGGTIIGPSRLPSRWRLRRSCC